MRTLCLADIKFEAAFDWKTRAIPRWQIEWAVTLQIRRPSNRTSPLSGGLRPEINSNRVVFPAPLLAHQLPNTSPFLNGGNKKILDRHHGSKGLPHTPAIQQGRRYWVRHQNSPLFEPGGHFELRRLVGRQAAIIAGSVVKSWICRY